MRMGLATTTVCCLWIISGIQGLELSLDLKTAGQGGHCAVLTCEESFASNKNLSEGNTPPQSTISSMRIFKLTQPKPTGYKDGNRESGSLLASLTPAQPKIISVSDGVKVDGVLEAGRATLRLEMVKEVDCSALYSCEVRTSDGQGNELVHTNRLYQRPQQRGGQADASLVTSALLLQQLALIQQQTTLLGTSLDSKFGDLETRMDSKLRDLSGKLGEIETGFESKFTALDTRISFDQGRLEDKILSVKDGIESKIENQVLDKLCKLETKLPSVDFAVNTGSQTLEELKESLEMWKSELKEEHEESLTRNALSISNSTEQIVTTMQVRMSEMLAREERDQLRFNNLTAVMREILSSSETLSDGVQNDFFQLNTNLREYFEELQSNIDNSSSETVSAVRDLFAMTNLSTPAQTGHADRLSGDVCKKGMDQSMGANLVIRPDGKSGLDVPYLCDSLTDGGGWIIIQRRSSGRVDFYRNWQEYRDGFGSLDDDFWLGNKYIHAITSSGKYELRIDLKYNEKTGYAHYSSFFIEDESNNYNLRLGEYGGTAGDDLTYHNGQEFSTYDMDNDSFSKHCAEVYKGAWWYKKCYYSNLNGLWNTNGNKAARWNKFSGSSSVTFSEMKIRAL